MSNGAVYEDGDYTQIQPCTLPVLSAPIPGVNIDYVLKQDFVQYEANFASATLNTFYPKSDGTGGVSGETWAGFDSYNGGGSVGVGFQLVEEGPREDLGDGVVRWTRTYAKVPAQHAQPGQISYNFIGWADAFLAPVIYRQRFTRTVPATSVYDYFLAASSGTADINSVIDGNFVQEQLYTWPRLTGFPTPPEDQATDFITNTASPATVPTLTQYVNWVSSGTNPIVAIPSQFTRFMGNILRRETVFIQPQ